MQTDRSSRHHLPDGAAFWLLASILIGFLAGSAAPTPLYATYAAEWGFSEITTTVVFGIYALAVLGALLVLGRMSDHVGRRPVLLAALVLQAAAMVVFEFADGVPALIVARIIQGVATGAAAGAVGAGLLDLRPSQGTAANAVSAPLGTGSGALGAGLAAQFLPAPTHLVYGVLAAVFALQFVGVVLMREPVARAAGALRSMRPEIAVPRAARTAVLAAAPAIVASWALPSFYASLGPGLVARLSGSSSLLLGGVPLFVLAVSAVPTVLATGRLVASTVMTVGSGAIAVGVGGAVVAAAAGSTVGFFAATLVAGGGFGAAFQGALRTVMPLAREHERAGLLSLLYVVSYLALGVPAMIGGVLAVNSGDLVRTAVEYGLGVVVLALLALAALAARRVPAAPAARSCTLAVAPPAAVRRDVSPVLEANVGQSCRR